MICYTLQLPGLNEHLIFERCAYLNGKFSPDNIPIPVIQDFAKSVKFYLNSLEKTDLFIRTITIETAVIVNIRSG